MSSQPADPKTTAVDTFLQSLRVSLNFISLYSRQHKSFLASVKDLQAKTDALLALLSPIKVFFTADAVSVDSAVFAKKALYTELARFFHARKVHYVQIVPGITDDELGIALELCALPARDIFRQGGLPRLLEKADVRHFATDELDYSAFLRDSGDEAVDVWAFLLSEAVGANDQAKLDELAGSFEAIIAKFRLRHLLDDVSLVQNVRIVLDALKANDRQLFERCTRKLFKLILVDKAELGEKDIPPLKGLLQYVSGGDMADALLNEIAEDEQFDQSSFALFTRLIEHQKHAEIAEAITAELEKNRSVTVNLEAARKLQDMFTVNDNPVLKDMYRKVTAALGSLAVIKPGGSAFDLDEARIDYHAILAFLLEAEKDEKRLTDVAARLLAEWEMIVSRQGEEELSHLCASAVMAADRFRANSELGQLHKQFSLYIEDAVFAGRRLQLIDTFLQRLRIPGRHPQEYFKRIIDDGSNDTALLKLFLKFYPDQADLLGARLAERGYDMEASCARIEALVLTASPHASRALEAMYAPSNDFLKAEIIKAIGRLPDVDTGFLSSILREGSSSLKKQALLVLVSDPQVAEAALNAFLVQPDPWARNNPLLIENLRIIAELGLSEAAEQVRYLYKSAPFWNIPLRAQAQRVYQGLR